MSLALASFLGGAGTGYMSQLQRNIENQRQAKMDQIALDNAAFNKTQQQRQLDEQSQLAGAAAPAQVDIGAGGMTKPASADNIDVGQPGEPGADNGGLQPGAMVNGQSVPDAGAANTAASAYNDPAARLQRQSDVMEKYTPGAGIALQNASIKNKQNAFTLSKDTEERARQITTENLGDAARAAVLGDPQAFYNAMNKTGQVKFTGVPTVTERPRDDIPGMPAGTKTYDYSGEMVDANGNVRQGTINSHDFAMAVIPYEKSYELAIKGTGADSLGAYRSSISESRKETADASKARATAYADREQMLKEGTLSKEKRLQYTDLFNKASQNVVQTQKALGALQADRMFMRAAAADPASAQAAQLRGLQSDLAQHKADYTLYQGFLSNVGKTAAPAGAPGAAPSPDVAPQPGMKGAFVGDPADVANGISQMSDPQERANAQAALEQQMKATGGKLPPPSLGAVPFKGAATPVKISTAAQRDALPKGTTYIAPNGQSYVKQ